MAEQKDSGKKQTKKTSQSSNPSMTFAPPLYEKNIDVFFLMPVPVGDQGQSMRYLLTGKIVNAIMQIDKNPSEEDNATTGVWFYAIESEDIQNTGDPIIKKFLIPESHILPWGSK